MRRLGSFLFLFLTIPALQGLSIKTTTCNPGLGNPGGEIPPYNPDPINDWLSKEGQDPLGQWVVGNGGDSLRVNMTKAKKHASLMVSKMSDSLIDQQDADVRDFLKQNKLALAGDIMASEHIWYQEDQGSCAWTTMPRGSNPEPRPIEFSYPSCKKTVLSYTDAVALLIHESAHHFFQGEDMADRIALAVIKAWRQGDLEWQTITTKGAPSPRFQHSAIMADDRMVVFGGQEEKRVFSNGALYDPKDNRWESISSENAPSRYNHIALYTGKEMIIWGGYNRNRSGGVDWVHEGAIYNFEKKKWRHMASPLYSKPQGFHLDYMKAQQAIWTGERMIVWGGVNENGEALGGIYDPEHDIWEKISDKSAPRRIGGHSMAYTGEEIIVWGGYTGFDVMDRSLTAEGSRYDIKAKKWREMSETDAPSARYGQASVWTGKRLIVFSGNPLRSGRGNTLLHATGGIYDPEKDHWTPFSSQMATERQGHTAVWTGKEVLIMGGKSRYLRTYYSHVVSLDPESLTWSAISGKKVPSLRWQHSAVWNGSSMLVWGGGIGAHDPENTGAMFFP